MIIEGEIDARIGSNVFAIDVIDGRKFRIKLNSRLYPEECCRLKGHVCPTIAKLKRGVKCALDIEGDDVLDIKFSVPDVSFVGQVTSRVSTVISEGKAGFVTPNCGCHFFINDRSLGNNRNQLFEVGQKVVHQVAIIDGVKVMAVDATILYGFRPPKHGGQ